MQQLGSGFVNSFLLPYIQNQILGNLSNDTRLQKMFRFDKVLRPDEMQGLEDYYFQDTGTVLQIDPELRSVFWREFSEFVARQKLIANGSDAKLRYLMLPDEKTGAISKDARKNLEKLAFYAVNSLEDALIAREIHHQQLMGTLSDEEAADKKAALKEGKLALAQKENGEFDYLSDTSIARALGNVERTAKILAEHRTEETPSGEKRMFMFNPLQTAESGRETSSSPQQVQQILWNKQAIGDEKNLERNGLYVEARMNIDANGIARGFVRDKNNTRLRIEFDVKKPGKRMYRMTFVDNPDKKFFVKEEELQSTFGKKRSAQEVYTEKSGPPGARRSDIPIKGGKVQGDRRPVTLPENRRITGVVPGQKAAPAPREGTNPPPYVPLVGAKKERTKETEETEIAKQKEQYQQSVIRAKKQFESRLSEKEESKKKGVAQVKGNKRKSPGDLKKEHEKKQKSLIFKVAKWYFAGIGGTIGLAGAFSIFS
ncbi:hypothetical protein GF369_00535 [Candidatus Peregrinibacteria bacterium]|nr:hypothetical protein [Candidatus Peregrinibacteria bacterium]